MVAGKKVNIGLVITVLVLSAIALVGMFLPYMNFTVEETVVNDSLFSVLTKGSFNVTAEGGTMSSVQALFTFLIYSMTEDAQATIIISQVFYILTIVGFAILVWDIVMSILMLIPAVRKTFVGTIYKVFTMIFGLISFFLSIIFIAMPVVLAISGATEVGFFNIITPAVIMLFVGFFVGFIIKMVTFSKVGKEVQ